MKKRILSLIVCVLIIFCNFYSVVAAELQSEQSAVDNGVDTEKTKVYTLSLAEAIKMARENDPQYENLDIKIKDAEKQLKSAERAKKDLEGKAIYVSQGISSFAVQRGYYVEQARIALESAKQEKEQTLANGAYSITQKYYNVKLSESLVKTAENTYKLANDNLASVKVQFDLGMVAQFDVNNSRYSVMQAEAMLKKYKRNLTLSQTQLAIALYIDEENFALELTDDLEYEKFTTDINADKISAMNSRYDVYLLDSAISQAEFMLEIARIFGQDSSEYSSANLSLQQCKASNMNTKKAISLLIDSSYCSILDKDDEFVLAQENLSLCEQSYDISLAQYELGIVTNAQLTAALNKVIDARVNIENAKLNHKLAVEKYKYEKTIGL